LQRKRLRDNGWKLCSNLRLIKYFASTAMKQAAAIFLMGIFSFNIFGYQFFYDHLLYKADKVLVLNLDKGMFEDEELISIKEPINLPYYTNSKVFQRIDGEVIKNGVIYRYVKSRIYNDSLEMLCIPHTAKMELQGAKEAFFKLANELEQSTGNNKDHSSQKEIKRSISEFEELALTPGNQPLFFASSRFISFAPCLPEICTLKAERPPNA
jgi:hypothetical protein